MRKEKVFIYLFLLIILQIGMINAEADLQTFKQNQQVTLYQMCDNCTFVNLTSIKYPNSTIQQVGENMVKVGNDYTYTFTSPTEIGKYHYNVCGDKDGELKCEVIYFSITPSGFSGTFGFYILILFLSIGVIILGFVKNDAPIVILGSFGLYFIGMYILFFGIDGLKDPVYTWALGLIILMLAAYISIRSSYELIVD